MDFLQTTLDGLLIGATYGMIGLGFTLIFGVLKRINLAYGSCLLFGAAVGVFLQPLLGYGALGLLIVTVAGAAVASIYVEKLCFAPHAGRHALNASMIASFAIWMQLDEVSAKLMPQRTHDFQGIDVPSLEWGPFILRSEQILVLGIALAVIAALYLAVIRSRFSLQITAVSEDMTLAETLGVPVRRVGTAIFVLAGLVGGLGAFLVLSSDGHVTPLFGLWATFKGLVAVMIGGLGSLPGAVVGGLLLGVLETHAAFSLGTEFRDIVTFGLLFLVLILRPAGLFGGNVYRTELMANERL